MIPRTDAWAGPMNPLPSMTIVRAKPPCARDNSHGEPCRRNAMRVSGEARWTLRSASGWQDTLWQHHHLSEGLVRFHATVGIGDGIEWEYSIHHGPQRTTLEHGQ